MKKALSLVTSVVLVATMLPLSLVQFDMVPKASAALCTISADTDITAAYAAGCDGITVDTSSTLTFHGESLDMNGSSAFTVNESVTVTWSGTGTFTDANDSIVVNGTITHLASGSGVIIDTAGGLTVGSSGSIHGNAKGCAGGDHATASGDGYGPDSNNVCTVSTAGYGIRGYCSNYCTRTGGGGGYGGEGGRGQTANTEGAIYGSSSLPVLLGSGGSSGYSTSGYDGNGDGGNGGGMIYLVVDGTLDIDGTVTADGGNGLVGNSNYGSVGGSGGSGGAIYIDTGTLDGDGSMSVNGGDGGSGSSNDGGGGGAGRVSVSYDTLSGFSLANISETAGSCGGNCQNSAANGSKGSDFLLNVTTDSLTVNSSLVLEETGDYTRANITFGNGATITCDSFSTLDFGATSTLSFDSVSWTCNTVDTINLSAATWTTGGTNTMNFSKAGSQVDWDITNTLALNNLTYTGGTASTSTGSGGFLTMDNAIAVSLVNTDITSSVYWDGISSLSIDSTSSIAANEKGCPGGDFATTTGNGYGPNASTNICTASTTGYGLKGWCSNFCSWTGGGGAYGGAGGRGGDGTALGGSTYGTNSNPLPMLFGSGGGSAYATSNYDGNADGGEGGGIVYLNVTGAIDIDGTVTSNGGDGNVGSSNYGSLSGAGGSGGSVKIVAGTLNGDGDVYANGGDGSTGTAQDGAGGGGGRVAFSYSTLGDYTLANSAAYGGTCGDNCSNSVESGSSGTVFTALSISSITIADTSGYTNDTTPEITVAYAGTDVPTHVAFSCNAGSDWSSWLEIDDDVANDGDGPVFDMTTGVTGCTTTEELKTITAKIKNASETPSGTANDTTTYDATAPTGLASLAIGNTTASTATVTWTAATEAVSFDHYELWYGTDQSDVQNRTGTAAEWDDSDDSNLTTVSTATTTITGLSVGVTYYLKIWAIDSATNESTLSDITFTTNQTPTAADLTVSQASAPVSGVNIVNVIFDADDADDDDTVQAKVEYNVGTGWAAASIVSESITATTGTPVVDNDQTYQIGQASGYIETSSGVNTITSGWASSLNVTGVDTSSAQVRVTPYDGIAAGTAVTSSAFVLDQVAPTGGFTETYTTSIDETSVAIGWDPITTETNFAQYTVYYKRTSTDTYSSAGTLTTMSTSASTITGLTAGVQYDIYVQAADSYGNTTNSPVLTFTTSQEGEGTTSSNVTVGGGGSGGGSTKSTGDSSSGDSGDRGDGGTGFDPGLDEDIDIDIPIDDGGGESQEEEDTDQQAGEEESGEEDYGGIEEEETEEEEVEVPAEETPTEEPTETPVEETEPDYISEPLHESAEEEEESSEEDTEEEPLTVGVFGDGEITQEVYEDEIVVSYYKSTDGEDVPTKEIKIDISIAKDTEIRGIDRFFVALPVWEVISAEEVEEVMREKEEQKEELVNSIIDYVEIVKDDPEVTKEEVEEIKESIEIMEEVLEDDDNDGILDRWEEENLNDTEFDGTADTDGDGLTDMEEYQSGSDPLDADTDNDGLSDLVEIAIGTDPNSWDTDKDGKADTEELFENEDPLEATAEEVDAVLYDEDNDTDGDGLSDYIEEIYNTDPYSADSDGDGITDTEELAYDTNPTSADYIEEIDTKVTNVVDETSFAGGSATFKGTSEPSTKATVYIMDASGGGTKSVITTATDETGKFSITTEDLPDGEYQLLVVSTDDKDEVKDFSTVTTFKVDSTQEIEPIEILELGEELVTESRLGSGTRFSITRPKLLGYTKPGYIIYVTWKSVVLTSVIVADTSTGEFEAIPPDDLAAEEDHTVYVYAVDPETNTVSETVQVNFTIGETSFLHESAAQREADEKTFPYMTLILLALVAAGGSFVLLRRGKSQQQEEQNLIKKL